MQLFYNCLHNKVYHSWRLDYSASESSSEDNDGEKLKNDLPPSLSKYKGNTFLIRIPFKKYPTFTKQKEILKKYFYSKHFSWSKKLCEACLKWLSEKVNIEKEVTAAQRLNEKFKMESKTVGRVPNRGEILKNLRTYMPVRIWTLNQTVFQNYFSQILDILIKALPLLEVTKTIVPDF